MQNKFGFTLKCLWENRLRFFLTVLSISVGVASVLTVNAISDYGVQAVSAELDSLGMNGLIVSRDSSSVELGEDELEKICSVQGVAEIAPVTVNTSKVYLNNADNSPAMIWGIDERTADVVSFELLYGRLINKSDIMSNNKVCILDRALAESLYGRENIVGNCVDLLCNSSVESFEVVGIVQTGKGIMQSVMGNYFPAFLYAPYTSFSASPNFDQFFLKLDGSRTSEEITDSVKKALYGEVSGDGYTVTDLAGQKGTLKSMLNIVTTVLTVIGSVSLVVSGISIINIMLISVNERIREIGIKKSIGATSGDILLDFLSEAVFISSVGTLTGLLAAVLFINAISLVLNIKMRINAASAVTAVALSVVLGMLFGIIPAYKASKFRPVEALRR